jgi:hypothetical protein
LEAVITFSPGGKEVTCAFKISFKTLVRSAVKRRLSNRSNRIQIIQKWTFAHIDVSIAGRSKLSRVGDVMGSCRERPKGFPLLRPADAPPL